MLVECAFGQAGTVGSQGTDYHSTTYGAIGAAGAGIGISEMTYVLATGELWMRVPETIRFELAGSAGPGTMAKDLVLHLAGRYGTDVAQYCSIEYAGPLTASISVAGRMTMANMGVELGAKFACSPPTNGPSTSTLNSPTTRPTSSTPIQGPTMQPSTG